MTALSDIGRVNSDWLFQSGGYSTTLTRLTDRTGLGNHLVRTGAAPTFVSQGGIEGMVMGVASTAFSCPAFLPAPLTFIAVTHALLDAADNIGLLKALPRSYGGQQAPHAANDPAWESPDALSVYEAAAKYLQVYLKGSDNTARILMRSNTGSTAEASAAYTNSVWQVIQAVVDPVNLLLKIRVNKGSIATAAVGGANFPIYPSEIFYTDDRVTGTTTGITTTGGKHCTLARMGVFNGDLFTDALTELDALVDALILNPAI
jgi:hypothetical protein